MKEVYVVKNYEDRMNMYVMGVFSSRVNAMAYIEKVEEKMNTTLFDVKVVVYEIDYFLHHPNIENHAFFLHH